MLFVYQATLFGDHHNTSENNDYSAPSDTMANSLIRCERFFESFNISVPVLLIDVDILEQLNRKRCFLQPGKPIKIAVDVQFLSHVSLLQDSRFQVVYYTNTTGKDFLDFRSDPRRIIPKNFSTRSLGYFAIPEDFNKFFNFWKRSKFTDCMNLHIPRTGKTVRMPAIPSTRVLARLRDELIENNMFLFLNGGTLLGWYRECSVIPHTLDMDVSIFAEDYNSGFLENMQNNLSDFRISRKFGMINDSFEMTVAPREGHKVFIDIFLMYKGIENGTVTHNWVGGVSPDGTKYKYTYPIYDPWCAADLLGHIFWVTCTPNEKIVKEYGKLWYLDHLTSKYSWNSSGKNVKKNGKWTKEEMKEVYKVFKG
ncbi:hypothetical protein CAEBREN_20471 [Caenorhabditis brenneri]|uniref:Fukutin n=1 Tax=Caenorhabditis brenneri TaxID=135651 RepID=G0MYY5_CAEBE|nr:hypothetical protein CAEBREN_20471 [Caenorhabditis brenneri]